MLDESTKLKLADLKIAEAKDIIESQERIPEYLSLSFDERFKYLVDDLYEQKMKERIERLKKKAHIKYPKACVSDIVFSPERYLNQNLIMQLANCAFINYGTNVTFYGPTRTGKSFLASVIANLSCQFGKTTLFIRLPDLISEYECKDTPIQRKRYIERMAKYDLLVLDEWLSDYYSDSIQSFLFEIIEKRNYIHSTIYISQYSPFTWIDRLGKTSKSESIISRIATGLCHIECKDLDITKFDCNKVKI